MSKWSKCAAVNSLPLWCIELGAKNNHTTTLLICFIFIYSSLHIIGECVS